MRILMTAVRPQQLSEPINILQRLNFLLLLIHYHYQCRWHRISDWVSHKSISLQRKFSWIPSSLFCSCIYSQPTPRPLIQPAVQQPMQPHRPILQQISSHIRSPFPTKIPTLTTPPFPQKPASSTQTWKFPLKYLTSLCWAEPPMPTRKRWILENKMRGKLGIKYLTQKLSPTC